MSVLAENLSQADESVAPSAAVATRRAPYKPFGALRFVLALLVLLQHYADGIAPPAFKAAVYPWGCGNIAVLGFFIISGFIICEAYFYNYWERPGAYMTNRLLRIVPVYWAALILSLAIHFVLLQYYGHLVGLSGQAITERHFHGLNIFKNFMLVFNPVRMELNDKELPFVPYAWALQVEMMFYATVFLAGVSYKVISRYVSFPQGYWLALAGFAGIAISTLQLSVDWLPSRFAFGAYFAFGGALFFFLKGERKALLVIVPALAQMIWHFQTYDADDFLAIPAYRSGQLLLMVLIVLAIIMLAAFRVQHTKTDRRLGDLSYPLYLNHYIVAIVILNITDHFSLAFMAIGLVGSILVSQGMFMLIEKPLMRVRRYVREGSLIGFKRSRAS